MKKLFFTAAALIIVSPLFAQAVNWDLGSVTSSLKTVVPTVFGIGAFVALVVWMIANLMDNTENYKKIITTAVYAVLVIAVITGIIYAGMGALLR